ncbi:hypothetical protein L9F63_017704 [Diploptera punctata]|uniref:Uncharacterized protein n=1 Tax=Diploptera punctata TaxID=6984 RepID=A0AAD7ZY76_DIPPU|nr:hypothetical protein L9F63_017704 [Diploptera punctata]
MGFRNIVSVVILVVVFLFQHSSCMECVLGHESTFIEKLDFVNPKSCPLPFQSSQNEFCCVDGNRVYCCDVAEFYTNGFGVLYPVLIGVGALIVLILLCCLCCCCCPCCWLYKRRQGGTVYQRPQLA